MSAELKKQVCDIIDDMADELVDASHAIHAKPEIAFEEPRAPRLGQPLGAGAPGLAHRVLGDDRTSSGAAH